MIYNSDQSHMSLPVVTRADLMAAGDQDGWTDFRRATTPVT